ncbi:V-type ATP synthase subunit F [Streptomyces sp. NPDC057743]|uniref:V-type ATP synthase subunit F n=1 Tax=Streptomyces sp. NPDC057743 TaxID=3346236 RepID=UPI003681081B
MGTVVAIGERTRTAGFALAGVRVRPADDPEQVRAQWREMPPDVALVILTPTAAAALGPEALDAPEPLTVVMPP